MPLVSLGPLHEGRDGRKELFKLVNEIRGQVNLLPNVFTSILTTPATGALTVVWGSAVPPSTAIKLTASVLGCTDDLTESCAYTIECAIVNAGGTVTFVGGTEQVTFLRETAVGTDATFIISGATIGLEVQDAGVLTTHWRATIYAEQLG